MNKISAQKTVPKPTPKVGQIYQNPDGYYILARVSQCPSEFALINLSTGAFAISSANIDTVVDANFRLVPEGTVLELAVKP